MTDSYTRVNLQGPAPEYQLTVITVCRNALADLKPTVESVLRQKAKGTISIEHAVVDGASMDGTPDWLAEQLAAGRIEHYVSEPDRGIYDAMNKGINLARGQVLAFLNAGDTYTDEDLAPCVLPICRGETQSVAASVYKTNSPCGLGRKPNYEKIFLGTTCCHQAYFASASAYRELGGYDANGYRCCADADVMCRIYRKWGAPVIHDCFVANFEDNGLSANCAEDFRNEYLELLWRNWDAVEQRYSRDGDFKVLIEAILVNYCFQFRNWQSQHGKRIPNELRELQAMCRGLARQAHSLYAKCALRWLARYYVPVLIDGRECPPLLFRLARFWAHACYVPDTNKYKKLFWVPIKPLSSHPLLRKFFPSANK